MRDFIKPPLVLAGLTVWLALSTAAAAPIPPRTNRIATARGTNRPSVFTNRPAAPQKAFGPATSRSNIPPAVAAPQSKPGQAKAAPDSKAAARPPHPGFNLAPLWKALRSVPPVAYGAIFFGALGAIALVLKLKEKKAKLAVPPASASAARYAKRKTAAAVHSCNVLQVAPENSRLWSFAARADGVALSREQVIPGPEPVPASQAGKDWRTLWQRKLNVAWLPPEQVFLRVIQLPLSEPAETLSMVELQLEKLSPLPVAQLVWSCHLLPSAESGMQTVVVIMVARSLVEQFLGGLESKGYLADRLELPFVDQLQATAVSSDGAWVYPLPSQPGKDTALVAWWYGNILRDLDLVLLPAEHRGEGLREQLLQTSWAGELEGWLTASPKWHLVAQPEAVELWEPLLHEAVEQLVEVVPALTPEEQAARTAARCAHAGPESNLLPQEYTTRYQQQFVDRLWMSALGGAVGLYLLFLAVYFLAVQVALFRTRAVENEVRTLAPTYTNSMQLKAQYQVLNERQELKYAALDCWNAIAEQLPEGVTLENFGFSDGKRLTLQGTAPMGQVQTLYQFEAAMRKVVVRNQALFEAGKGETLSYHTAPGGNSIGWSFALELKRSEAQ